MNSPSLSPPIPQFQPRREFVAQSDMAERVPSEIALLALSGVSLLRLCSFSPIVINDIRYFLTHTDAYSAPNDDEREPGASSQSTLLRNFREDTTNHLIEFALEGRPWTISKQRPGALHAEHLFMQILSIVLRHGYTFLSQVDYGREHDDRVSLVFSRSLAITRASTGSFDQIIAGGSAGGGSSTGLHGDLTLGNSSGSGSGSSDQVNVVFALSFASATELRVIKPPLDSTPAILHAVRTSWPRGVVSEKKISHDCYQFKLKGYHWYQQDTFSLDSLRHIQTLLTSLDAHGFTLLTSLTLSGNHSRVKDLWVFTGLGTEQDLTLSRTHTRARSHSNAANVNGSPIPGRDGHIPTPESSESSDLNLAGIGAQTQSPGVYYAHPQLGERENTAPRSSSSVLRKKPGHRKSLSNPSNNTTSPILPSSPSPLGNGGPRPSPRVTATALPSSPPPLPTRVPVPEILYATPVKNGSPYGTHAYPYNATPYPQHDADATRMSPGANGVIGGGYAYAQQYRDDEDKNGQNDLNMNQQAYHGQQVHFWTPQRQNTSVDRQGDDRLGMNDARDAAEVIGAGVGAGATVGVGSEAVNAYVDPRSSPNGNGRTTQKRGVPRDVPQSVGVFPDGDGEVDVDEVNAAEVSNLPPPSSFKHQHSPSPTPSSHTASTPHLLSPGVFRDSAFSSSTDDDGTRFSGDSMMGYPSGLSGVGMRGTMGTIKIPIAWTGAIDAVQNPTQSQFPAGAATGTGVGAGTAGVIGGGALDANPVNDWGKTKEELQTHTDGQTAKPAASEKPLHVVSERGGVKVSSPLIQDGSSLLPAGVAAAFAHHVSANTSTSSPVKTNHVPDLHNFNYQTAHHDANDFPSNGNDTTQDVTRNTDTTDGPRVRDHDNVLVSDPVSHQTSGKSNATQNESPKNMMMNPTVNSNEIVNTNAGANTNLGFVSSTQGSDNTSPDRDSNLNQHVQSSSATRSPNLKGKEKEKQEEVTSGVNVHLDHDDRDREHIPDPSTTPNPRLASPSNNFLESKTAIGSTPIISPIPPPQATNHDNDYSGSVPPPPPSFNRLETSSTLEFSFPGAWQPTPTLEKSAAQVAFTPANGAPAAGGALAGGLVDHYAANHDGRSQTADLQKGTQVQGSTGGPGPVSAGTRSQHHNDQTDYPTPNHSTMHNTIRNDENKKNDVDSTGNVITSASAAADSEEWNVNREGFSNLNTKSNPPLGSFPPTVVKPLITSTSGSASGTGAKGNERDLDPAKSRLSDMPIIPGHLPLDKGEDIAGSRNAVSNKSAHERTPVITDPQQQQQQQQQSPESLPLSSPSGLPLLHKIVDAERAVSPDALSRPHLSAGSDHKSEVAVIEHLRGGASGGSGSAGGEDVGRGGDNSGSVEPKKKEGWVMIEVEPSASKAEGGEVKSTDYAAAASTQTSNPAQSQAQASGDTMSPDSPPMTPPAEQVSSMSAVAKVIAAADAIAPAESGGADVLEHSKSIVVASTSASPAPATPSRSGKGSGTVTIAAGEDKDRDNAKHGRSRSGSGSGTPSSPSSTLRRLFSRSHKSKSTSKSKLKP